MVEYQGPTGNMNRVVELVNHNFATSCKDWIRQELSMNVKYRESFEERQGIFMSFKVFSHKMMKVNVTDGGRWTLCVSRYDTLRRTEHHLCKILAENAWFQLKHEERSNTKWGITYFLKKKSIPRYH